MKPTNYAADSVRPWFHGSWFKYTVRTGTSDVYEKLRDYVDIHFFREKRLQGLI